MKTFLASGALLLTVATLATPTFAHDSNGTGSVQTGTMSQTTLTCMKAAVDARESAVITARTTLNAAVLAALSTRRTSLAAAFTISANSGRQVAINASWKAYQTSVSSARKTYTASVDASWKTYAKASATCRGVTVSATGSTAGNTMKHDDEKSDNDSHVKISGNAGLHLGESHSIKNMIDTDTNASGGARFDLSF